MKTLSYKVFYIMFEVTFIFYILVAIVVVAIEGKNLMSNDYSREYSIGAFDSEIVLAYKEKVKINQTHTEFAYVNVESGDWKLKFSSRDTHVKLFMTLLAFINIMYVFSILFVLRKFVLSLKMNSFFTYENVKRLRTLGILVLLIEPLRIVIKNVVRLWMTDYLSIEFPSEIIHKMGSRIEIEFGFWSWVLAGLLILVIAEVFKQGLKMKEEQDLTI